MPKHLRRRLFYILIVLFFLIGTGAVLYAQGWRLELQPLGLGKVGAVYVRTFPADARLALDDEDQERTPGIFDRGTFVGDVLPGPHDISVNAPGYHPWNLRVAVTSSLVTTLRSVVLVPAGAAMATTSPVADIGLAGRRLVIETGSGLAALPNSVVVGDELLAASGNGSVLLTYATSSRSYILVDLDRATSTRLSAPSLRQAAASPDQALSFNPIPGDNSLFLAQDSGTLRLLRASDSSFTSLAASSVTAADAVPGRVFWTTFSSSTQMSLVSFYDIPSGNLEHDADSVPGRVVALEARDTDDMFVLTDEGILYALGLGQSSRNRLANDVRSMALAGNGEALAVLGRENFLEVFFLRGEKPDIRLPLEDTAQIQEIIWYRDGEHLFIVYPDRTVFLDLADLHLENLVTAAPSGRVEYDPESNILYFVKDNAAYTLVFPSS